MAKPSTNCHDRWPVGTFVWYSSLKNLAVVSAILLPGAYVENTCFAIRTDRDALKWILILMDTITKLALWRLQLSEMVFNIGHGAEMGHQAPNELSQPRITVGDDTNGQHTMGFVSSLNNELGWESMYWKRGCRGRLQWNGLLFYLSGTISYKHYSGTLTRDKHHSARGNWAIAQKSKIKDLPASYNHCWNSLLGLLIPLPRAIISCFPLHCAIQIVGPNFSRPRFFYLLHYKPSATPWRSLTARHYETWALLTTHGEQRLQKKRSILPLCQRPGKPQDKTIPKTVSSQKGSL